MNVAARLQLKTRLLATLFFLVSIILVSWRPRLQRAAPVAPSAAMMPACSSCWFSGECCHAGIVPAALHQVPLFLHSRVKGPDPAMCAAAAAPQIFYLNINSCNANLELWLGLGPIMVGAGLAAVQRRGRFRALCCLPRLRPSAAAARRAMPSGCPLRLTFLHPTPPQPQPRPLGLRRSR